jgi:hypothetical protein
VSAFSVSVPTIADLLYEAGPNETLSLTVGSTTVGGSIIDTTIELNLFNTGVDDSNHALSIGMHDSHYSLIQAPAASEFSFVENTSTNAVTGAWINNDENSTWIGQGTQGSNSATGTYIWQTTFDMPTNASLETIDISFDLWADNRLLDIIINGQSTGISYNNLNQYGDTGQHISLTENNTGDAFQTGINTIEFKIQNLNTVGTVEYGSGPTGLRIDNMLGTVEPLTTTEATTDSSVLNALDILGGSDIDFGFYMSDSANSQVDFGAHVFPNEMLNIIKQGTTPA